MKNLLLSSILILLGVPGISQAHIPVTILGVHHFHNPGADMFNIYQDDVKAPGRQGEIQELVRRLESFKPTKVLVETTFGSELYQERYRQFVMHRVEDSLTRNEIEQVGFRLAALGGHDRVYPFDYRKGMDLSELQNLASKDPEVGESFQAMMTEVGAFIEGINDTLQQLTLLDFLIYMNRQESVDLNHQGYLRMLKMTGDESFGASSGVSDWYTRNIHMFYNINRIVDFDDRGERILIIVGQGHKAILQDLIEDAPYYEYVDVLDYLTGK
jgi:hypothetical protein